MDKYWNVLAVALGVVMVLCVVAKKFCGCFADVPVTPFAFYALLALLSIPCRKIPKIPEKYWYPVCLGALAFPFFCFLLGSLGFLIGVPLTKWHGVVALLMAVGVLRKLSSERKVFVVNLLVVVGLWLGCLGMASLSRERIGDPLFYHKPAAILMAEGWNPVWLPELKDFLDERGYSSQEMNFSHAAYFPKGEWVIVGVTYLLTGIVDAGDYVNLLLILVGVILFYHLLKKWLAISPALALVAAFLLALNRTALEEMNSGMIDGNLGLCFLLFLLSAIVWMKTGEKKWLPLVLGTAIFGCTLKHTAPVYFGLAGMVCSLPMVWNFFSRRNVTDVNLKEGGNLGCSQHAWWSAMGTIFVLVILCGWNPYVTNTWNHTSPFYPLHTFDGVNHPKEDILAGWYTWDHFREASAWQRFFYLHLILREGLPYDVQSADELPVEIEKVTFFSPYQYGTQWGIFPLVLIFSLGMLFFVRKWDRWLVVGSILLTIAIQPHSWWDRFVPQMYALPVLILVILQSQTREYPRFLAKRWTIMTVLLLFLLLWSSSLSFMNLLKEQAAKVLLESKEMELRQSVDVLYTGSVGRHGNSLENHPPLHDNRWFRFYARHYLRQEGLENLPVMAAPVPFDWEKTTVYYSFGWIYCLPRHETEPPQTENDVFLDYSDVSFSELPETLKILGMLRWKQLCNAWNVE